jgi:putative peptidoglycan lipid II flippase
MANPSLNRRIVQSAGIVMAGVFASRLLGFLRQWTVAHEIGSNAATDAFYAAFTLPDFLNYLVAGGALSVTFIPIFSKYFSEGREDEGWHVLSTVMCVMGVGLAALVVVAEVLAPHLLGVIAPGFGPKEKQQTLFLTRLMLPAQICFYLGSILAAAQYAKTRFLIPSLAPVIYNLSIIAGGVLLSSRIGVTGFSVGVLAGALIGNFLLQIYGAHRAGAKFSRSFDIWHPGFRLFIKLSIPVMLALSLVFTDDWIVRLFGSYLEHGSITWLAYAKSLMQVPQGVVGQAVGVASFPFLAQLYAEKKFDQFNRTLTDTIKGLLMLMIPISALTIAMDRPLIYFVFSHTRMHGPDLDATAFALGLFSLGMFAWGSQGILARGFYAMMDTLTPAIVGTAVTFLNLPIYWIFAKRFQYGGLALASSIGITTYAVVLFFFLSRRALSREAGEVGWFFVKLAIGSALGAFACLKVVRWMESRVVWQTMHGAFFVLVPASAVGFVAIGILFKCMRVGELDALLRRLPGFTRPRGNAS